MLTLVSVLISIVPLIECDPLVSDENTQARC